MKLFYAPGACSLAVHIVLRELRFPFEPVRIDFATRRSADGQLLDTLSPRGYVPVLELDDGSRHTEVAALLQHLAERDQSQALIGANASARRFQVQQWLAFIATELHKPCGWLWQRDAAAATQASVRAALGRRFAEIDRHLAGRESLADGFSIADAYAFAVLGWAPVLGMSLEPFEALRGHLGRIAARPAVQAAMQAEGLLR